MEKNYLQMLALILQKGEKRKDRTGVGTLSVFGIQSAYDLRAGFPLLTTKKMALKAIIYELLWFLQGNTNIQFLVKHGVRIWNEWPFAKYQASAWYQNETLTDFVTKIKNDNAFAQKWGFLGPVYGRQWRNFGGVDQIKQLITSLKTDPFSRRHIISAWNPPEITKMLLPPCHLLMQFYVASDKTLSCQLYQRSADMFLGVPFNIASYALLTLMLAQVCNLKPGKFIHTIGDAHIYLNHIPQVKIQLSRQPYAMPQMVLNSQIKNIFDFTFADFKLINYQSYPLIRAPIAV